MHDRVLIRHLVQMAAAMLTAPVDYIQFAQQAGTQRGTNFTLASDLDYVRGKSNRVSATSTNPTSASSWRIVSGSVARLSRTETPRNNSAAWRNAPRLKIRRGFLWRICL